MQDPMRVLFLLAGFAKGSVVICILDKVFSHSYGTGGCLCSLKRLSIWISFACNEGENLVPSRSSSMDICKTPDKGA